MSMTTTQPSLELLEEENLSQECKELISSLPREMGYSPYHFYLYHGFWFQGFFLDGILACQKHFQAHGDDILLVTLPKSGTTWLKAITFALLNRENHPPKNNHNHPLLKTHPHDLIPFLEARLYIGGQVPDLSSFPSPRLFATHIPFTHLPQSAKDSSCKLVYLCRNPKDTLISLWQFTNKLRSSRRLEPVSMEVVFDSFCRGLSISGPFWDHILDYWRKSLERPEKVLFIKYEEMKEQTAVQFRRLADFLGCPFSHSEDASGLVEEIIELCSFENLSNLEVNKSGGWMVGMENNFFFRRGEVGDWKNYLTPEMVANLDKICEQKFKGSGLKI